MKYINVIVDNKSEQTDTTYTYAVPDELEDEVTVGSRLTVPFARRKKPVDAYCVSTDVVPDFDLSRIKEITDYNPDRSLNEEMIDTAFWMRRRYGVKYFDAIKMFTVGGKRELKNPPKRSEIGNKPDYELTGEQTAAASKIESSIEEGTVTGKAASYLLKGVTNSGKTEVYMKAVEKALSLGRTAIVLLPEIALSEQVMERFINRFGEAAVATLHSKLTTSKRLDEWLRIRRGEARIVVGARTSVFAPLDDIGVIVIDEEHEGTYKSDHNPKYETVDIAFRRASFHGATLVLGSATPSVVSYSRARNGIYKLIEMNHRVGDSIMPELEIVDMRREARAGNTSVISRELITEVSRTLNRGEQVILFLNRRGYSTQIMCPDCGYIMTCEDCGITMTYHRSSNAAVCHYCGKKHPVPRICPDCGSKFIKYAGAGTEKVEATVQNLWRSAKVARFDLDTAATRGDIRKTIRDFQNGEIDILVGTQILAKGLDFRNVGLVGLINADVSLNIPDYRSSERTYQLITQVAGRAGRTGGSSRVIIQTYEPESDIIQDAADNNYDSFFESELLHRNIMNYPPFSDIISVSLVEKDPSVPGNAASDKSSTDSAEGWDDADSQSDSDSSAMKYACAFRQMLLDMKGAPDKAVVYKPREEKRRIDGRRRVLFMIKAPVGTRSGYINAYMAFRDRMIQTNADCYIEIDVNPYGIV